MLLALLLVLTCGLVVAMFKWPNIALALYYNGTAVYFYVMFKLNLQPTTTITGLVLTGLVSFPIAARILARPGTRSRWRMIDTMMLVFFMYIAASAALLTDHNAWVIKKLTFAPTLAILPYLAGRLVDSEKLFNGFVDWVVRITAVMSVFFMIELGTDLGNQTRFALFSFGDQENEILVGLTFGILTTIMYVRACESRKQFTGLNNLFVAVPFFLTVRSGSRGGLGSTIASILFYHLLRKLSVKRALLMACICLFLYGSWRLIPTSLQSFYLDSTEMTDANSIERRFVAWQIAEDALLESPLFGRGFGVFSNQFDGSDQGAFAHNVFLELAAETGIVGLLLFGSILLMTVQRVYASRGLLAERNKSGPVVRLALVLFVQALVEAQFSGYITQQAALFLTLGVLWGLTDPNNYRTKHFAIINAYGQQLRTAPGSLTPADRAQSPA